MKDYVIGFLFIGFIAAVFGSTLKKGPDLVKNNWQLINEQVVTTNSVVTIWSNTVTGKKIFVQISDITN